MVRILLSARPASGSLAGYSPVNRPLPKRLLTRICLLLCFCGSFSLGCLWLDPSLLSVWYGEEVMDREEAKEELRSAVRLNVATCPENDGAGAYAIEFIIPNEINHLRYFRKSIEDCATVMLLVPCDPPIEIETEDDDQVQAQIFLPALRACNPRPIPEAPIGQ